MGKKLAINFATVRIIGFALVQIGFFLPIASGPIANGRSGFNTARRFMDGIGGLGADTLMGLLMYAVTLSAVVGVVIGVLTKMNKKTRIPATTSWIVLLVGIASGLIVFFSGLNSPSLQAGGILILLGWIVALAGQVLAKGK